MGGITLDGAKKQEEEEEWQERNKVPELGKEAHWDLHARKLAASSYDLLFALREQPRNTELEAKESEERAEQKKKKRLEVLIS